MTDLIPPDAELMTVNFVLEEVGDDIDDRVFTELPKTKVFPAIRIHQFYDEQVSGPALWQMRFRLQIDVWGGTKNDARTLADRLRYALVHRFPGARGEGVVTHVEVRNLDTTADESVPTRKNLARPRCRFDVDVWAHPSLLVGS